MSRVGDCHQPVEVQPRTFPGCTISRGRYRLHLFQGFSISGTRHTAAVNSRRISILRLASRELMALAAGRPFFAGSPRSWRPAEDAFPPALPPSFLEPSGSGGSYLRVDGVSSRSPVVAPSPSSLPRRVSAPSVTRPSLLVRRLGRGLGRPSRLSGRFRPVERQSGSVVNQRQGTPSCSARAVPVPVGSPGSHGGCLLRQHHSGRLPSQGGWHQISSPQQPSSGDLTLDGVPLHPPDSTVSSGLQQCPGRRSLSPSPTPPYRMVSQHDRISVFEKTVAGSNRLVCHLSKSSLFDLLLPFPGSAVSRHRRLSPVLGRPSGLCIPSGSYNSTGSGEAPGLQEDGANLSGSPLGSAPLVFGPSPAVAGSSCSPTIPSRPPALASVSSTLPGSPSAQASCLATLQRYTRAAGFSSAVAEQSSLARRPSSRAVYQARWSVYRDWCHSNGHSVSRPTLAKVADFLYWLRFSRGLSVSSLRGYRSALSAVFCFHLPSLSSDPVIRNLLRSFRLSSAERVMRPPA